MSRYCVFSKSTDSNRDFTVHFSKQELCASWQEMVEYTIK